LEGWLKAGVVHLQDLTTPPYSPIAIGTSEKGKPTQTRSLQISKASPPCTSPKERGANFTQSPIVSSDIGLPTSDNQKLLIFTFLNIIPEKK
jgi:hypothetical protein